MEDKNVYSMYNFSYCTSWPILTNTHAFSETLMLKFCHSELVKVLQDGQTNTFLISIRFIFVFHVKMLPQLHFPGNSFIYEHERLPFRTFQPLQCS